MNKEIAETKRVDLMMVSPQNCIVEEGFNVRREFGDLRGLAKSIVELGVIEPIIGFKNRNQDSYTLTDGHRRLSASLLALELNKQGDPEFKDVSKIERIPLRTSTSNKSERLYIMSVTGENKKALTELERAEMFSRLIEFGKEEGKKKSEVIKEIIQKLGISSASVYNSLKLNELDPDVKAFVESGELSGGTAIAIARKTEDKEKIKELVVNAVYDAEEKTTKEGKKKKATASNVKGLKEKFVQSTSPLLQDLSEVVKRLDELGINNLKARVLFELVDEIQKGSPVSKLVNIFL